MLMQKRLLTSCLRLDPKNLSLRKSEPVQFVTALGPWINAARQKVANLDRVIIKRQYAMLAMVGILSLSCAHDAKESVRLERELSPH